MHIYSCNIDAFTIYYDIFMQNVCVGERIMKEYQFAYGDGTLTLPLDV